MSGQVLHRFPQKKPQLVGRAWPDASRELQEFLNSLFDGTSGNPGGFNSLTPLSVLVGGTPGPGDEGASWMSARAQLVTAAPTVVTTIGASSSLGASSTPAREDHTHKLGIPSVAGGSIGSSGGGVIVDLPPPTFTLFWVLLVPAGALDVVIWRAPWAATVTAVKAWRTGGTSASVNARRNGASEHLAADLVTTAAAWVDGGAVQNTAYTAGDSLEVRLKAVVGAPPQVAVQVEFTRP